MTECEIVSFKVQRSDSGRTLFVLIPTASTLHDNNTLCQIKPELKYLPIKCR